MIEMPKWAADWIVFEFANWHLKDGAPDWIKKEFEELMRDMDAMYKHQR